MVVAAPTAVPSNPVARMQQIRARFGAAPEAASTGSTSGSDFAALLAAADPDGSLSSLLGSSPLGSALLSALNGTSTTAGATSASGDAVVEKAKQYQGIPYVWGGTDPSTGLDCSGFVQHVY